MRVAIFHDYFSFIGGGEKVVLTLARHLGADIITTDLNRELISRMGYDDVSIISLGSLAAVPPIKQVQATLKFSTCNFTGKYDFYIFSGNWAHHASRNHRPNLIYCYTPVRVFYDLKDDFLSSQKNPLARMAASVWVKIHTHFNKRSMDRIDTIVSISDNVARRVKKYLGKDSTVIYPPCDTSRFLYAGDDGYWLSVNRLYPEKRLEVQINAFARMPEERLIMIGNSGKGDHSVTYAKRIRESLPPNVTIISDIPEDDLINYYGRCRGFITTSLDEDFGMTAIEAMASGKPVIAVREGGYLETVADGKTGMLIDCKEDDIIKAVKKIASDPASFREACVEQSKKFDVKRFLSGMDSIIGRS
ncbi:glycosyltransferase family 4 protein [Methanocella sp. CWC-04]|uniref:Glycosyltransferase family 4 protein n=1 Tax=Methanooceanicella nereidis TaxID=2052831 RepID=A0AAP2W8D7_9EURY|nr:glycosyltransferase [Methanocella sp. CWC-04]MCD1296114.1 glycosyltransferase family 4 protein [Methanocella sp. CWC-04]